MMAEDLAAMRRRSLAESKGNRLWREKTDFIKCVDSPGRYADVHSNRHTSITTLLLAVSRRERRRSRRVIATSGSQ